MIGIGGKFGGLNFGNGKTGQVGGEQISGLKTIQLQSDTETSFSFAVSSTYVYVEFTSGVTIYGMPVTTSVERDSGPIISASYSPEVEFSDQEPDPPAINLYCGLYPETTPESWVRYESDEPFNFSVGLPRADHGICVVTIKYLL